MGPDTYTVNVTGLPDDVYLKSVKTGQQESADRTISLGRGDEGPLELALSPTGGEIHAVVLNAKQQAGAGATVVLVPDSHRMGLYQTATADQHGNVILHGIPPGHYRLYAWEDVDQGAWFDPEFVKPFESQGQSVNIRENSREGAQLNLIPAQ
jgi:hypothetical protein